MLLIVSGKDARLGRAWKRTRENDTFCRFLFWPHKLEPKPIWPRGPRTPGTLVVCGRLFFPDFPRPFLVFSPRARTNTNANTPERVPRGAIYRRHTHTRVYASTGLLCEHIYTTRAHDREYDRHGRRRTHACTWARHTSPRRYRARVAENRRRMHTIRYPAERDHRRI